MSVCVTDQIVHVLFFAVVEDYKLRVTNPKIFAIDCANRQCCFNSLTSLKST